MKIDIATSEHDLHQLVELINISFFQSEESSKGWTNVSHMLEGIRTTPKKLEHEMSDPNVTFLKCTDDESGRNITACVKAHLQGDALYVGLLSVRPELQAKGLGRKMMGAVEDFAKKMNCVKLIMEVVESRTELVAWYERQGYKWNGVSIPFPAEDYEEMTPKIDEPLILIELEKPIH